ncbi:MAG TPA: heme-degrading domain-containing protein [Ruminiclostridium sp.]
MGNYDELLKELVNEENELQFTEFTNETALKIGLNLIEKAKDNNKRITINITRNGHQLFHYSFGGTTPENDQWIIRKNRVVNRFSKSSLHVGTLLLNANTTIEERHHIKSSEYAAIGGAFPIIIKNTGVIGTITVSGLPKNEDHDMVVAAIKEQLRL